MTSELALPESAYGAGVIERAGADAAYRKTLDLIRAAEPEKPVFCVSPSAAHTHIENIQKCFPARLLFAVKACPLEHVIVLAHEVGISRFDVASPEEIALVRRLVPGSKLFYNNPIRAPGEIETALFDHGVRRFAVDDRAGLEALDRAVGNRLKRKKIEIAVRLRTLEKNAGGHDFTRKFGADDKDAISILKETKALGFEGSLTFHPGSQCADAGAYSALLEISREIADKSRVRISAVNVGGGFPAPYAGLAYGRSLEMFSKVQTAFGNIFDGEKIKLRAEPGRAFAAPIVSIVTQVKHIRPDGSVFLNDGIFGAFAEFEYIEMRLPVRFWRKEGEIIGPSRSVEVYGPTCDPSDAFPYQVDVPLDLKVGDWLEFGLIGGYGPATVTRFNGYGSYEIATVEETINNAIFASKNTPA